MTRCIRRASRGLRLDPSSLSDVRGISRSGFGLWTAGSEEGGVEGWPFAMGEAMAAIALLSVTSPVCDETRLFLVDTL